MRIEERRGQVRPLNELFSIGHAGDATRQKISSGKGHPFQWSCGAHLAATAGASEREGGASIRRGDCVGPGKSVFRDRRLSADELRASDGAARRRGVGGEQSERRNARAESES